MRWKYRGRRGLVYTVKAQRAHLRRLWTTLLLELCDVAIRSRQFQSNLFNLPRLLLEIGYTTLGLVQLLAKVFARILEDLVKLTAQLVALIFDGLEIGSRVLPRHSRNPLI